MEITLMAKKTKQALQEAEINEDPVQEAIAVADPPQSSIGSDTGQTDVVDPSQFQDEIARTAYALWEKSGFAGSLKDAWFRAKAEVMQRHSAAGVTAPKAWR
jgi:hypothetical protein